MAKTGNLTLTGFTLSTPDPQALGAFYSTLLSWPIGNTDSTWVSLTNPAGGLGLNFHIEDQYQRPVWPSEPGNQIMQGHLEIQVDDLDAACAFAAECGATLASFQPQENVRVHLDPDGHPFCLFTH